MVPSLRAPARDWANSRAVMMSIGSLCLRTKPSLGGKEGGMRMDGQDHTPYGGAQKAKKG